MRLWESLQAWWWGSVPVWGTLALIAGSAYFEEGGRRAGSLFVYALALSSTQFVLILLVGGSVKKRILRSWYWLYHWHWRALAIILLAGIMGGALFGIVGGLAGIGESSLGRIRGGFGNGAFYGLIWAPGISIVICIMKAHRENLGRSCDQTP